LVLKVLFLKLHLTSTASAPNQFKSDCQIFILQHLQPVLRELMIDIRV